MRTVPLVNERLAGGDYHRTTWLFSSPRRSGSGREILPQSPYTVTATLSAAASSVSSCQVASSI